MSHSSPSSAWTINWCSDLEAQAHMHLELAAELGIHHNTIRRTARQLYVNGVRPTEQWSLELHKAEWKKKVRVAALAAIAEYGATRRSVELKARRTLPLTKGERAMPHRKAAKRA